MKFFEKTRVELYFHGGKLRCDGKTGMRSWRMTLIITLKGEQVVTCDETITSNFLALETRENCIEEIKIAKDVPEHIVEFFGLGDHTAPMLRLGKCSMTDLKMTRVEGCSELWITVEHENTDKLHAFVKDYVFTRFWAEFAPVQLPLPIAAAKPTEIPKGGSKAVN